MTTLTVFLCGDVMTGRGIDQILWHPCSPEIHEPYVRDARDYVELAEQTSGTISRPVDPAYIWGDALGELDRVAPHARVINLETSITQSSDYWKGKGINYRMHPDHIASLTVARIDVCTLANNHVLDYGYEGLKETVDTLKRAGLRVAGAGGTLVEARQPAVLDFEQGRLFVWSVGTESSGVPPVWAATANRPGIDFLDDLSDAGADVLANRFMRVKRPGDIGIASIHWGSNWGYDVPESQVRFAHRLIDSGIDIVHGHSSHHPRPIEVYRGKLVLYGCGDFLNDYEGISGHEQYRGDLALMYFPTVEIAAGRLVTLRMVPMRVRKMKLNRVSASDAEWLRASIKQASAEFGCDLQLLADGSLALRWGSAVSLSLRRSTQRTATSEQSFFRSGTDRRRHCLRSDR
jgi:poly-gamma-glutamate capsule biosynthesis protein CapA/YwtB (metallophosphatase superfamily)